jgi:tetratricopeptide (TPR) repeat protein
MESGQASEYVSLKDNTICLRCGKDNGATDFPLVGDKPFCYSCGELITNWPYPKWLKVSLACLLVLLLVALVHGRKYFRAGRAMYKGERLVQQGDYTNALPYLQETLRIAPGSDKAVLLLSKAALLTGNVAIAQQALQGHGAGHFENADSESFRAVDALWTRAINALEKIDKASKIANEDGKAAEAARLMHEAAAAYPEMPGLAAAAEVFDEGTAFEQKDYDTFLAISMKQWKQHPGSETAAAVASALACKYAVTGDAQHRVQANEMLGRSHELVSGNPEAETRFEEYSERIEYRLKSRQIISTTEYNRRFRSNLAGKG